MAVVVIFLGLLWMFINLNKLLSDKRTLRLISYGLAMYAVTVTTFLSSNWQFPHFNYRAFLPVSGLEQIAQDTQDIGVLNIPLEAGYEPSHNLMQALHAHKIYGGYVSYIGQPAESKDFIAKNPLLANLECSPFPFDSGTFPALTSAGSFRGFFMQQLRSLDAGYVVVRKDILYPRECDNLRSFVLHQLPTYDGVRQIDENQTYSVYTIDNSDEDKHPRSVYAYALSGWEDDGDSLRLEDKGTIIILSDMGDFIYLNLAGEGVGFLSCTLNERPVRKSVRKEGTASFELYIETGKNYLDCYTERSVAVENLQFDELK